MLCFYYGNDWTADRSLLAHILLLPCRNLRRRMYPTQRPALCARDSAVLRTRGFGIEHTYAGLQYSFRHVDASVNGMDVAETASLETS